MQRKQSGKSLIVGASGQVGAAMVRYWSMASGAGSVLPAARSRQDGYVHLDLAALHGPDDAAALDEHDLNAILCVAGWTWVDGCEDDPDRAFQVNAHGPAALAAYAYRRGVPFVYYSTDYLFDGTEASPGPYAEESPLHPINVYGESKAAGEAAVRKAHPEALILRTAGVYGYDGQGKNFLYTVLRTLQKGEVLRVPVDQVSTPTYNVDLARSTFALLEAGASGVYHLCGPEVFDRVELARAIAAEFGLDTTRIVGVTTADLKQRANRPLLAGLQIEKFRREFPAVEMRTLKAALAECKDSIA